MSLSDVNLIKILLCTYYFVTCVTFVTGGSRYVEPLNSGLQMAIPYDIANIFIRPISGTVATFLSLTMFVILFFGVITSPFGYMFGIPSRKYVLGSPSAPHSQAAGTARGFLSQLGNDSVVEQEQLWEEWKQYDFSNALFFLLPEDIDKDCNLLLVCYAHGIFKKLPISYLKTYRFFSQKLINGREDVKIAAKVGLGGHQNCVSSYKGCPYGPFKLIITCYMRALRKFKL